MALLTLEGFEVPVVPGTEVGDEMWGDYARAYSSAMRSDRRASNRIIPVAGSIFDTADDAVALRAILNTPGKVLAGGTMVGDDAYFHVRNLRMTPVTVDRLAFRFELHETADSPSPLLFSFDGDAPGSYTHTRPGNVGPRIDASGLLRTAAANVLRREHLWLDGTYAYATLPDTASYLLEAARTNLVGSDDFDAGWTSVNTPVITTGITDPAGGTLAYRIANDAGVNEYKVLTTTFTGDAQKMVAFLVRESSMPASGTQQLKVRQVSGAAADRLLLDVTSWTSGSPNVTGTTGTYVGKAYKGRGYWLVVGLTTSLTAAETNQLQVIPSSGTDAGAIDIYRAYAFNSTVPSWSLLDASEVIGAETLYAPFTVRPQAMTGFVDFIEGEYPTFASQVVMQIGNAAGTGALLSVSRLNATDNYRVTYNNGSTGVASDVDIGPTWGDRVRIRWTLSSAGVVQIGAMKDSGSGFGSETTGSASSALALQPVWADQRLYISHPTNPGTAAYVNIKVARGSQTMAYMADLARGRLHPRTADHGALFDMAASVSGTATTTATES